MSWQDERRADRIVDREQARLDLAAAAELRAEAEAHAASLAAARREDLDRRRQARQDSRRAQRAAAGKWLFGRLDEVLIYALAVVSAGLAVPAMALYGLALYGPLGLALPALSEAGSWSCAFAVQIRRARSARDGEERPTGTLTFGIATFAMFGMVLNFLHGGFGPGGSLVHGVVMALVSVSGIVAHQIVVAAPPRSRADRDTARLERLTRRRLARAGRAAARRAVVELAADGTVTLLHAPGRFTVHRGELRPASVPGLPVDPVDDWDSALVDLLDGPDSDPTTEADQRKQGHAESGDESGSQSGRGSGRVAVADPSEPTGTPIDPQARRRLTPEQAVKAARRFARRKGSRVNAEELRRELGVAMKTARELRDQVNGELFPNGGGTR